MKSKYIAFWTQKAVLKTSGVASRAFSQVAINSSMSRDETWLASLAYEEEGLSLPQPFMNQARG